jgi:hypothetical protein
VALLRTEICNFGIPGLLIQRISGSGGSLRGRGKTTKSKSSGEERWEEQFMTCSQENAARQVGFFPNLSESFRLGSALPCLPHHHALDYLLHG